MSDIDRREVIEYAKEKRHELIEFWEDYKHENKEVKYYDFIINSLETDEAYQLEYEKPEICEDCISRKEIIDRCNNVISHGVVDKEGMHPISAETLLKETESMPSVLPKAKKGHWICDGKGRSFADYHCSECGLKLALCGQDIKQRQDSGYSLFCGGCGADMREVEE